MYSMHKASQIFSTGCKIISGAPLVGAGLYNAYWLSQSINEKEPITSDFSPQTTTFVRNLIREYGIEHPEKISLQKSDRFSANSLIMTMYLDQDKINTLESAQNISPHDYRELEHELRYVIGHETGHLKNNDAQKGCLAKAFIAISSQLMWDRAINRITKPVASSPSGKIITGLLHLGTLLPKFVFTSKLLGVISRRQETLADKNAFDKTQSKEELQWPLSIIKKNTPNSKMILNTMCIVIP